MIKKLLITALGRLLWHGRGKLNRISDEEIRSIARAAVQDGKRPFSVMMAEARDRLEAEGFRLDDATDERLINALDIELWRARLPGQLAELAKATEDITHEFDRAEKRGRATPLGIELTEVKAGPPKDPEDP